MPHRKVWSGAPSVKGFDELVKMALLTFSLAGLQFTWGMEMTYCTPYLLELGLTKSKTSLVWLAGPLSGMIMAPAVGAVADRCTSRWGRRRPFMVGGAVVLSICLVVLGWAKEIIEVLFGTNAANGTPTVLLAVASIYALDFAINAVQWSCRSLIVDTLPISKQQKGTAWGGRMIAIGHLVGYYFGSLDLEQFLGNAIGGSQFKRMIIVAVIGLNVSVGVTSWAVTERVLVSAGGSARATGGPIELFHEILRTAKHMPQRMKAICWVQFWSWIGWFPFLFYSSEWVGEIYLRHESDPTLPVHDRLATIGRVGSKALIVYSIVTSISSISLPAIIRSPDDDDRTLTANSVMSTKPTLLKAWFLGQFIFAGSMILAPFVTSVWLASLLIASCGVPWAMTIWAPHAFMGVEISRLSRTGYSSRLERLSSDHPSSPAAQRFLDLEKDNEDNESDDSQSGIYLGILNLFTTMPQFIGTFMSALVFWMFEPGKGLPGRDSTESDKGYNGIGICLFLGSLCALVAAGATRKLRQIP